MTTSPTLQRLIVGFCVSALFFALPGVSAADNPGDEAFARATLQAEGQRWQSVPDQGAIDAYHLATLQVEGQRLVAAPDQAAIDAYTLATMGAEGERLAVVPDQVADGGLMVMTQPDGQVFSAPTADSPEPVSLGSLR